MLGYLLNASSDAQSENVNNNTKEQKESEEQVNIFLSSYLCYIVYILLKKENEYFNETKSNCEWFSKYLNNNF